jgi:flagellar protein FliS
MLYEGAISFLERSRAGFQDTDPGSANETINNNVQRAQAIINELNTSLNMAEGGEFSANMRRLYNYFDTRLHEGNIHKEESRIVEVIKHLSVLRDAWAQMLGHDVPNAQPVVELAKEVLVA